jgi:hypothetical protein
MEFQFADCRLKETLYKFFNVKNKNFQCFPVEILKTRLLQKFKTFFLRKLKVRFCNEKKLQTCEFQISNEILCAKENLKRKVFSDI